MCFDLAICTTESGDSSIAVFRAGGRFLLAIYETESTGEQF